MPRGLRRFQQSHQTHFVTFTCFHRRPNFDAPELYGLFLQTLEAVRRRFALCICGYVVMPEHVHLLLSDPDHDRLADAIHDLKLSFAKRARRLRPAAPAGAFWQKRYHDRNERNEQEFGKKLRYLQRNPVKRGLVREPAKWNWSSFRHYALREKGVVEIESEWTATDRELHDGATERIFLLPG